MSKWESFSISQFCKTGTGGTPSRSEVDRYYKGGTIPWVKSGELRENIITATEEHITEDALKESSVKLVPAGALLLALYGATVGRLGTLGVEATTNQAVCHIIPDPQKADTRYLFHALANEVPNLVARGVGGAQPNISQGIVKDLQIPLPPLAEQKRIARILDAADALRAKRREALTQLDALLQSTFLTLFGDPVTNPIGWPMVTIGDLLISTSYGTSKKAHETVGAYPCLRMNNITYSGDWNFSSLKYVDLEKKELPKYLVHKGQLLFNRTNSKELVGKTGVYREETPMAYAGYLVRGIVDEAVATADFISSFLNLPQGKAILMGMCKNIVGMANINAQEFRSIQIPKPPLPLQQKFAAIVESVERQKAAQRAHLAELDALFASLQHRAFRGEL